MNIISPTFSSFPPCGALLFSSVKRHGGQRKKNGKEKYISRERERERVWGRGKEMRYRIERESVKLNCTAGFTRIE